MKVQNLKLSELAGSLGSQAIAEPSDSNLSVLNVTLLTLESPLAVMVPSGSFALEPNTTTFVFHEGNWTLANEDTSLVLLRNGVWRITGNHFAQMAGNGNSSHTALIQLIQRFLNPVSAASTNITKIRSTSNQLQFAFDFKITVVRGSTIEFRHVLTGGAADTFIPTVVMRLERLM